MIRVIRESSESSISVDPELFLAAKMTKGEASTMARTPSDRAISRITKTLELTTMRAQRNPECTLRAVFDMYNTVSFAAIEPFC